VALREARGKHRGRSCTDARRLPIQASTQGPALGLGALFFFKSWHQYGKERCAGVGKPLVR